LAVLGVVARGPASLVQEAEPYALRKSRESSETHGFIKVSYV
jgi:hypothetical protein